MSRNVQLEDRITKFAARCVKVCEAMPPKRIGSASFAYQLFRSSTSVAANYSEASQAESRRDFGHKLKVALKELNESRTWLKIVAEVGYVGKSSLAALIEEAEELTRILSASVITARKGLEKCGNVGA